MAETEYSFVETLEDLVALNEKLCKLSEFAVDLEVQRRIMYLGDIRSASRILADGSYGQVLVILLFSIAAPFLQEFPRHHQSDADLYKRGGLYSWHPGAPQWDVHTERGVHWPSYCQGNRTFPQGSWMLLYGSNCLMEKWHWMVDSFWFENGEVTYPHSRLYNISLIE